MLRGPNLFRRDMQKLNLIKLTNKGIDIDPHPQIGTKFMPCSGNRHVHGFNLEGGGGVPSATNTRKRQYSQQSLRIDCHYPGSAVQ